MRFWTVILFSILIGLSCSSGKGGKAPIPEEQMIDLLVDMHMTDAVLVRGINQGAIKNDKTYAVYKSVFNKYNVSPQLFDSAFTFYSKDLKRFDRMYKVVSDRLKEQEVVINSDDASASNKE